MLLYVLGVCAPAITYPYKVLLCSSALFSSKVLSSGGEGGEGLLYALGVGSSYFNMLLLSALYAPAL